MLSNIVRWTMSLATRVLLSLRYRMTVRGLEEVARRGRTGILFLPNHAALIDPVIMVALLYTRFAPRPLADEHQVARTAFGRIALLFGSRTLPNFERQGAGARERIRAVFAGLVGDLRAGDNLLIYPAGRIKRGYLEDLGSASGTELLVRSVPEARIVLVRHNGLWGSGFSMAATGRMPDFGAALWQGIKGLLASGLVFMPRRPVTIEFVEPDDFPRHAGRAAVNRYLERFYNDGAARNTYVPYSIWERRGVEVRPEPEYRRPDADASAVPGATRDLVLAHLRDESGRPDIVLKDQLNRDLGMDSLAVAELVAWIEREFGFSVGSPESLVTVADVVLAAAGRGISAAPADVRPAPAAWWANRVSRARVEIPPGATIPEVFLAQARRRPDQPLLLDQSSGVRTYRDLVTAILILKPLLERVTGSHVGIMLPASVGASVFLLASQFAGKTPVMVNWTTGMRTIRHSLELLGVSRVITARALVAKLATLGVDLTDIEDRFWFVEDLLGGLTTRQKLSAGLKSRFTWKGLEDAAPPEHAVVLFTSGSEALPKAVPLTHRNLLTNARDMLPRGEIVEGDVILGMLPPFHSFGLTTNVVLALCAGIRTAYHPIPTESAVLARLIETYGATVLIGTPTFLAGIVRVAEDRQLATLRLVVTGAERCPDSLYEVLGRRWPRMTVLEGYGITECSPVVSVSPLSAPVAGSIGLLLDSLTGAVVDLPLTRRVAPDETGLLLVRGPSVFPGYLHHEGESPFVRFEGETWYRTGDLVRQDTRGVLYFEGRLKRFIKLGGEMISLPAIESVLLALAPTQDGGPSLAVEAIGDPDSPDVTLFTTVPIDRAAANAAIREAGLSPLHHIRQVIRVDELPVLGTGKTDYRRLKERYGQG